MIGLIICGHGNFATGMYSALKLIAGEQENFKVVDFTQDISSKKLIVLLEENIRLVSQGQGVVIFTDIPGGTPFNQGGILSSKDSSIKVIAGTNLPLLLEACFNRRLTLEEFIKRILDFGKCNIKVFTLKKKENALIEEGI